MDKEEIAAIIERLENLRSARDLVMLDKQKLEDEVLTVEIKAALLSIKAEFEDKTETVNNNIATLEDELKRAVLEHGATVTGQYLQAVFVKGRASWDTKKLEGFAASNPAILDFRKVGSPSVSLRSIFKTGD